MAKIDAFVNWFEVDLFSSMLREEGIPFTVLNDKPQDWLPLQPVFRSVIVDVPDEYLERATEMLTQIQSGQAKVLPEELDKAAEG